MKKILSLLFFVVSFAGHTYAEDITVSFDFTDKAEINALGISTPDNGSGTNVESALIKDGVTITNDNKEASTHTRIWATNSGVLDLRVYNGAELTITVAGGKYIKEMTWTTANSVNFSSDSGTALLLEIAREYPSLISYISPTHMGRTHELFLQAIDFARLGGMIDISTGGTKYCEPYLSVLEGLEAGIDIHQMTFSSDGNAGVRRRNAETGEDTYLVAPLHKNLEQVVCLIREAGLSPADAFSLITTNPARNMHLTGKGRIAEGGDADITLFDDQWKLQGVWARGVEMMREGVVLKKGNFES